MIFGNISTWNSIPGYMVPGDANPGRAGDFVLASGAWRFKGFEKVYYLQYLDLIGTGTLSPSPGDICVPCPVESNLPVPPAGPWIAESA